MKGKKSLGKNVSQKEKVAKEEEKYREDTKAVVEEATSTVSGLTYSRVEVLPDIIAEAPHKGVKDRELDNEHVLQLMKIFYTSQNPNDKIEWVGWMCDKSDKVGYTEDLGLGEEDDELLVPPPFCKKEVVQEFVDKWKAAGLINPEGDSHDWNNIPLAARNGLQLFLKKNMQDGSLPMQAFDGLHTSNAIQRVHEGDPKNPLWQTIRMSKLRFVRWNEPGRRAVSLLGAFENRIAHDHGAKTPSVKMQSLLTTRLGLRVLSPATRVPSKSF